LLNVLGYMCDRLCVVEKEKKRKRQDSDNNKNSPWVEYEILRRKKKMGLYILPLTIPREPYTALKVQGKPYFCNICPRANDIVYAWVEDVRTLLKFSCANYG